MDAEPKIAVEFRSMTQSVEEAIVVSDARGRVVFWNEGAETIFGYAEKDIVGKPLTLLIPMPSRGPRGEKLPQLLFSQASPVDGKTHELQGVFKGGRRFPVELSLLTSTWGRSTFFMTVIRDITERKRLQKEILDISAREQQRIGQDLHDDLCQQLTAITLLSEVLEKKLVSKSAAEAKDAAEIHKLIAQSIVHTRLLAKGLLPVELEATGLMAALEDLSANTERIAHLSCRAREGKRVLIQRKEVAVHLYRIAQEAVTNAVKHAHARHIDISLTTENRFIVLSVEDDGVGLPKNYAAKNGLGLSIMNSRAETINATLRVERQRPGGTRLTCTLRAADALNERKLRL
jgi:two-component system, LuxR family, sensor kinase FixL